MRRLHVGDRPCILLTLTLLALQGISSLAQGQSPAPDRYVSDMIILIGDVNNDPVRLVLTFSRGTTDRDTHTYAAECTGHVLVDSNWMHLGPGRYSCPETTLSAIPPSDILHIRQSTEPPVFLVDFNDRMRPFRLRIDCLDFIADVTKEPNYQVQYDTGPATLFLDKDTLTGTAIHCRQDFTGYNRLAGNTRGYFPGRHEFAALAGSDGSVFLFSSDPVACFDTDTRVRTDFAACRTADGETKVVFDSAHTLWPISSDSLYPGKPIPREWITQVEGQRWQAHYADRGHFFYFTGFGIFAVEGNVLFRDTTYEVLGVVEHIHARNEPR